MTTIRFLVDYRGKLTGERFYQEGQTMEVEPEVAAELAKRGRAEIVQKPSSAERKKETKTHE